MTGAPHEYRVAASFFHVFLRLLTSVLKMIPAGYSEKTNSHLRISNVKGRPSYYLCSKDPNTNQRSEQYIRKKDLSLAANIAQQEYDQKLSRIASRQLFLVKRFLKEYDEDALEGIYRNYTRHEKHSFSHVFLTGIHS